MPDLNCPHCQHQFRVPDSLIGKRLRCKNEACKRPFLAELQPARQAAAEPWSDLPLEWQQELQQREAGEQRQQENPPAQAPAAVLLSDERYPNLVKYLAWGRVAMNVLLILALVCIGLMTLGLTVFMFITTRDGLEIIGGMIILIAVSAFSVAISYLYFVCMMAGIELIQVVIDIEENTRKTAAVGEHS